MISIHQQKVYRLRKTAGQSTSHYKLLVSIKDGRKPVPLDYYAHTSPKWAAAKFATTHKLPTEHAVELSNLIRQVVGQYPGPQLQVEAADDSWLPQVQVAGADDAFVPLQQDQCKPEPGLEEGHGGSAQDSGLALLCANLNEMGASQRPNLKRALDRDDGTEERPAKRIKSEVLDNSLDVPPLPALAVESETESVTDNDDQEPGPIPHFRERSPDTIAHEKLVDTYVILSSQLEALAGLANDPATDNDTWIMTSTPPCPGSLTHA